MPSWRSGNTHGFCVTGGHSPIASEPTPSRRLWAAAPGATPALRIEHTTGGRGGHSKPERSTLLESGTFYFALTGSSAVDRVLTFEFNQEQTRATRAAIEAFLTKTGAQLWIQHGFNGNAKLKKSPKFYE
jgi:hypothetical protein